MHPDAIFTETQETHILVNPQLKLSGYETFISRPGRHFNVLVTLKLYPRSTEIT